MIPPPLPFPALSEFFLFLPLLFLVYCYLFRLYVIIEWHYWPGICHLQSSHHRLFHLSVIHGLHNKALMYSIHIIHASCIGNPNNFFFIALGNYTRDLIQSPCGVERSRDFHLWQRLTPCLWQTTN